MSEQDEAALSRFRAETRAWLEENCPPAMRGKILDPSEEVWGGRNATFKLPESKLWLERMVERGWTAPTWPKQYGGGGLSDAEARVLDQEMRRIQARAPLKSFGLWMLGPVLLEYANEEQRQRFLPGIIRGETRWCQGYSEPGAGSDLASLATRAELDGDHYVINGQKTWTSHADKADWMFCLVRTDASGKKHDGISFILIDMQSPGVSVKPIQLISGASPFCESFFEDVRVPAENLVGELHRGWAVAKRLLQHERALISKLRDDAPEEDETLPEMALRLLNEGEPGPLQDAHLRAQLAQVEMDFLCNKLTLQRSQESIAAGIGPGPETSMFKLYGTELNKRRKELKVLLLGYQGLGWEAPGFGPRELQYTREWLRSRANSIEGGSSEVQLNIIAKRVLGLPGST